MIYPFLKRFFDLLFSALAILILLPLMLPIMLGLRLTGEGYVFYFQKRMGWKSRLFDIWKFATMLKNSPSIGTGTITLRNDPRVLPMGGFLRRTKINELPQLVNVFLGSMSFVGPRPLVAKDVNRYPEGIRERVYDSKPGITGIGSIVFRDEEALVSATDMAPEDFYDQKIFPYKGQLEMWYRENKSFSTDFLILFLTAWAILFSKSQLVFSVFKDLPKRPF